MEQEVRAIDYLVEHPEELMDEVCQMRRPIVLAQDGEPVLVVQDYTSWTEDQKAKALLIILLKGQQQVDEGKYRSAENFFQNMEKETDK